MPEPLFTFADLIVRVCPVSEDINKWKIVRHLYSRPGVPNLVELFHLDRKALEFYQAEQAKDIFRTCDGIFSFLGLPGRRALFVGAYQARGSRTATAIDPARRATTMTRPGSSLRRARGARGHRLGPRREVVAPVGPQQARRRAQGSGQPRPASSPTRHPS
ncbi:hypothetical protein AB3662_43160 [Sorangium cellulosum]|uniref:hypothetical protein n=1 Tax=Sorangium cellulosum TaxID=56 RepID=UPI003D9A5D64